jgi:dolichol-phosphate mannosyltransferase
VKTPRIPRRLARFCVVGASGVAVNMGVLILLTEMARLPYAISSLIAIEVSILTNFAWNNAWTWADCRSQPLLPRLIKYHAVAGLTAMVVNWCVLVVLTHLFHMDYRIANLIGIAAGVVQNFLLNHVWTFAPRETGADQPQDDAATEAPSISLSGRGTAEDSPRVVPQPNETPSV